MARTTGTAPSANDWRGEADNYRLAFASYDDNGNLKTLRRRGLLANATHTGPRQFGPVDALTYAYAGNRLQAVDDAVTTNQLPRPAGYEGAPTSLAGDFQEGGMHQSQEYLYDANGSLTQDRNKGISGIAYNHLNLPRLIHFGMGADSIVFRYTAAGQKVARLVYQHGKPTLRTDYLGPYQYEQDSLRFFPHAEGRVLRFANPTSGAVRYEREFSFKDHLGNLRLAYRLGQRRTLTATLEQDAPTHARESQQFDSLSVSLPIAVPTALARTGAYAARLNAGGSAPRPLGPLTQFAVQKGDTVRATAFGLYPQATSNNSFFFSLAGFVTSLLNPGPAAPAGADGTRRGGLPLLQVGLSSATLTALNQLPGGVPKGYLRVLSFNEDSVLVDQRTVQLSAAALGNYETLSTGQLIVQQNGYVSVYVGNESAADVYFDDLTIEHRQGLQVQENQYDPWGLSLAGLDYASPGIQLLNQYQFGDKERQNDLGLSWSDYGARMYDGQLGRWHGVDPLADAMRRHSPYSYAYNNPVRFTDPDGMAPNPGPSQQSQPGFFARAFARFIGNFINALIGIGEISSEQDQSLTPAEQQRQNMQAGMDVVTDAVFATQLAAEETSSSNSAPTYGATTAEESEAVVKMATRGGNAAAEAEPTLARRAEELHNLLPQNSRGYGTTAVAEVKNPDGTTTRIVGSNKDRLPPVQRAGLKPGEVEAGRYPGDHAEVTTLKSAAANGQTPTRVAASRPICSPCHEAIKAAGAQPASPLKKVNQ